MSRTRYLPPGSMRRQRRLGRLEGSVATLALVALLGFGLIAATPAEMYRPAPATHRPTPEGGPARILHMQMPPCGIGKDCSDLDDDGALRLLPRVGPQQAPSPYMQRPVHHVPEPGTLSIVLIGLIWIAAGLLVARFVGINKRGNDES